MDLSQVLPIPEESALLASTFNPDDQTSSGNDKPK
jgi:hypothetical protein